jgi:hypothetical protein
MYPNLETEQSRFGHSDEYVAQRLGITAEEYRTRKESSAILLSEGMALVEMYGKSMDYLFGAGVGDNVYAINSDSDSY